MQWFHHTLFHRKSDFKMHLSQEISKFVLLDHMTVIIID
jgi:hypothetical protein